MKKVFSKKVTDVVCYFSVPGWLLALWLGDYKKSKVHINQAMTIGILSLMSEFAYIIAQMFFRGNALGIAKIIYDMLHMLFLALNLMGIFRALRKNDSPMPIIGRISMFG